MVQKTFRSFYPDNMSDCVWWFLIWTFGTLNKHLTRGITRKVPGVQQIAEILEMLNKTNTGEFALGFFL